MTTTTGPWWTRVLRSTAKVALILLELGLLGLAMLALSQPEAGEHNVIAGGTALVSVVVLNAVWLRAGGSLIGIPEGTSGQWWLVGSQAIGAIGAFVWATHPEVDLLPKGLVALPIVHHFVLSMTLHHAYVPSRIESGVARRRLLLSLPLFILGAMIGGFAMQQPLLAVPFGGLLASAFLGFEAFRTPIGRARTLLPQGATPAEMRREIEDLERRSREKGMFVPMEVTGGSMEKNMVSGFARGAFGLALLPLLTLAGIPLFFLYVYIVLFKGREGEAQLAIEAGSDLEPAEGNLPMDLVAPQRATETNPEIAPSARSTAVKHLSTAAAGFKSVLSAAIGSGLIFAAGVGLALALFIWGTELGGFATTMSVILFGVLSALAFSAGTILSLLDSAELMVVSLQGVARDAAMNVIQRATERFELGRKQLPLERVEELMEVWTAQVTGRFEGASLAARVTTRVAKSAMSIMTKKVRGILVEKAKREGRDHLTLGDLQTAMCTTGLDAAGTYLLSYTGTVAWITRAAAVLVLVLVVGMVGLAWIF